MPSHKQLSNWYLQLGQHLEAGVLIADALRLSEGVPAKGRFEMASRLEAGDAFNLVMGNAPKWLPKTDRQFLVAGMETGNLSQTLKNLSTRHAKIGATQMKVVLGMIYPLGVYHVAAVLIPIVRMIDYEKGFSWDVGKHLIETTVLVLPVWALIGLITYLARSNNSWLPRILRLLPILRAYSKAQGLADLSYALGTFISAGVPVPSAWRLSIKIVNDPAYHKALKKLEPVFAQGLDPSHKLKELGCFPADFIAFYSTGAESSKLDSNLIKVGDQYQDRANSAMTMAAIAYPTLAMAVVAFFVISTIFKVYTGYLDIFDTLDG